MVRPLALGYLRLWAADPPEVGATLIAELHSYADQEGLTLAGVYTDLFDPPADGPDRPRFCALTDAIRRLDPDAVIIPGPDHLSRYPRQFASRRTIIDTEGGARLLIIHPGRDLP